MTSQKSTTKVWLGFGFLQLRARAENFRRLVQQGLTSSAVAHEYNSSNRTVFTWASHARQCSRQPSQDRAAVWMQGDALQALVQ